MQQALSCRTCVGGAGVMTDSLPAHTLPIVSSSLASTFWPSARATGKPSATAPIPRAPSWRSTSSFCGGAVPAPKANSRARRASTQEDRLVNAMATVCSLLSDVQSAGSTRDTCYAGARRRRKWSRTRVVGVHLVVTEKHSRSTRAW